MKDICIFVLVVKHLLKGIKKMVRVRVVTREIHNPIQGIKKGSGAGLEAVLIALEGQVKTLSPVDTGLLRASIRRKRNKLKGLVFTNVSYAIYQEEGNRAANGGSGFMKPAVDLVRVRVSAIFGRALRAWLRRE